MNGNPFSGEGCIGRLPFALTTILLSAFGFGVQMAAVYAPQSSFADFGPLAVCVLLIVLWCFAFMKRLRDVGMDKVNLGVLSIGMLFSFILWIYLAFKKGGETAPQPKAMLPAQGEINSNPFSREGRLGRAGFALTSVLLNVIAFLFLVTIGGKSETAVIPAALLIIPLDIALYCFAVMKRLRHIGLENVSLGVLSAGLFIPVVNWLYLAFKEGVEA